MLVDGIIAMLYAQAIAGLVVGIEPDWDALDRTVNELLYGNVVDQLCSEWGRPMP